MFTPQIQSSYKLRRDDFTEVLLSQPLGPVKIACHKGALDMLNILDLTSLQSCKPFSHLKTQWDTHYMNTLNLWQSFREWQTNELFQNFQLITLLLSSTVVLVQTYQKPIGYYVLVTMYCSLLMPDDNNISFPSFEISPLSKPDSKHYVLLHA